MFQKELNIPPEWFYTDVDKYGSDYNWQNKKNNTCEYQIMEGGKYVSMSASKIVIDRNKQKSYQKNKVKENKKESDGSSLGWSDSYWVFFFIV